MPQNLFGYDAEKRRQTIKPLADRMRPASLDELAGQEKLVGKGTPLRLMIERDQVPSMIFWGPPGSGKTTLARIIAAMTKSIFIEISAVMAGVQDIRLAVKNAENEFQYRNQRTILFIDEIHRFNKAQQDALLPYVENGTITLIGATTENPSFEVISALLSRCKVFVLNKIERDDVLKIVKRAAVDKERGLGGAFRFDDGVLEAMADMADGDARHALNAMEMATRAAHKNRVTMEILKQALQRTHLVYDKGGEEHYNIISALHKSLRASDPDAALYWLGRMLEGGDEPLYIARRLVRFASEDIGLADPQALVQAMTVYQACHALGMPECNVHLAQAVAYLALAPKSRALDSAYAAVRDDIKYLPNEPVPMHIRNAPTALMKQLGYGQGSGSNLPEKLKGKKYWVQ